VLGEHVGFLLGGGIIEGDVDLVLVMSVNPGFGGQAFIPAALEKIRRLSRIRKDGGFGFMIEVDGGVVPENAADLTAVGADILVAGSAMFNAASMDRQADAFFAEMEKGRERYEDWINR
jgi:ribulose-phosphate 3-epimerase